MCCWLRVDCGSAAADGGRVWSRDCRELLRVVTSCRLECGQEGITSATLCVQSMCSLPLRLSPRFAGGSSATNNGAPLFLRRSFNFFCCFSVFCFFFAFHFFRLCVTRCCSHWSVDTQTQGRSSGCASNECARNIDLRPSALHAGCAARATDRRHGDRPAARDPASWLPTAAASMSPCNWKQQALQHLAAGGHNAERNE